MRERRYPEIETDLLSLDVEKYRGGHDLWLGKAYELLEREDANPSRLWAIATSTSLPMSVDFQSEFAERAMDLLLHQNFDRHRWEHWMYHHSRPLEMKLRMAHKCIQHPEVPYWILGSIASNIPELAWKCATRFFEKTRKPPSQNGGL